MARKPSLFPWLDRAAALFDAALAAQQTQVQAMASAWQQWLVRHQGLEPVPVRTNSRRPGRGSAASRKGLR